MATSFPDSIVSKFLVSDFLLSLPTLHLTRSAQHDKKHVENENDALCGVAVFVIE